MVDLTCYSSYGILSGISAKVKVQNAISPPTSHHIAEDFLVERYEVIRAIKERESTKFYDRWKHILFWKRDKQYEQW